MDLNKSLRPFAFFAVNPLVFWLALLLLIGCTTAAPEPTPTPEPAPTATSTPTPEPLRPVTIWVTFASVLEQTTLIENRDLVGEINFFWYQLGANGQIRGSVQGRQMVQALRNAGMQIVPSIVNAGFNRDHVAAVIGDEESRRQHIEEILALVREHDFEGIDIDYESLSAEDREAFSLFIEELAAALHAEGKILSIAVHAKTSDTGRSGAHVAQDWARLGAAVDAFKIMTYDYHSGASPAGPIAPVAWIDEVLTYAASVVPPEKTYMGVHFYGRDWVGSTGEALEWRQIMRRAEQAQAEIQRDESGEGWFTYDDGRRTAYFADAEAIAAKLSYILERHPSLAGIAIWRLGGEDPENWAAIRAAFEK
jgi:spore germination protein